MKRTVVLLFVLAAAPGSLLAKTHPRQEESTALRTPCATIFTSCSVQPLTSAKSTADAPDKAHRRR